MIRVVGANPALDRISTWPPIRLGEVNRAASVTVAPGGKGFNVARAVVRLGSEAASYGFLGGHVGDALRDLVVADGVIDRHTEITAETRVCFIVVEPESARGRPSSTSQVRRSARPRPSASWPRSRRTSAHRTCSSSRAACPTASIRRWSAASSAWAGRQVPGRSSTSTAPRFAPGIEARPWMVKVNREELLDLADAERMDAVGLDARDARSIPGIAARMAALRARGIEVVVVTLGADGVLLADASGVIHAAVPSIEVVNPTGSGDLVLAGLAAAIERGQSPHEALVLGAACGTAGATHLLPELPPDFDADVWTTRVSVRALPAARPGSAARPARAARPASRHRRRRPARPGGCGG